MDALKARNNVTSQAVMWAPSPDLCVANRPKGVLSRAEKHRQPLLTVVTKGTAMLAVKLPQAAV